jgi:hypothetical protein
LQKNFIMKVIVVLFSLFLNLGIYAQNNKSILNTKNLIGNWKIETLKLENGKHLDENQIKEALDTLKQRINKTSPNDSLLKNKLSTAYNLYNWFTKALKAFSLGVLNNSNFELSYIDFNYLDFDDVNEGVIDLEKLKGKIKIMPKQKWLILTTNNEDETIKFEYQFTNNKLTLYNATFLSGYPMVLVKQ